MCSGRGPTPHKGMPRPDAAYSAAIHPVAVLSLVLATLARMSGARELSCATSRCTGAYDVYDPGFHGFHGFHGILDVADDVVDVAACAHLCLAGLSQ